jgi:drug/metabolite transporter (DMT)-like permease
MDKNANKGKTLVTQVNDPPHTLSASGLRSPLVLACLAATWFLWGTMYLAIKWALVSFPPFYQMGSQFLVAGAVLGCVARLRGAAWPRASEWLGGAVMGTLLISGGYGFMAVAETSVGSGLVVAFTAIVPTMVVLGEWPYGVRPDRRQALGVGLGLIGIVMMTQGQGFGASLSGLLAVITSCATWTVGSVWAVHGLPGGAKLTTAPGSMGHASQMLIGGALLLAVSRLIGETPTWPPAPMALACWVYVAIAGSLIGYTAYLILLERTTPALATSYTYVNPVVALILGVTLGQETVSRFEWLAVVIVLCGVVLLMSRPGEQK